MAKRVTVKLHGAARARRMLKELGPAIEAEMVEELKRLAPMVEAEMKASIPVKTGGLRSAITSKVYPKTLRMRVGLLTKKAKRAYFYGWILERGRRARSVLVRRGPRKYARGRIVEAEQTYNLKVSPISRDKYDFIFGATRRRIQALTKKSLNRVYERALRRASRRAGPEE